MSKENLLSILNYILSKENAEKIIISKPVQKSASVKKIVGEQKSNGYQFAKYTDKQVFHENIDASLLISKINELTIGSFRQINMFTKSFEHILLVSKDGGCTYKKNNRTIVDDNKNNRCENLTKANNYNHSLNQSCDLNQPFNSINTGHNRKKNYIIGEGTPIPPLVDMGIFTKDGKIVNSMYDKYKQINRFLEILDDEIKTLNKKSLNVIDFGCGKSYLTFVVYYYLTEIKNMDVNIIGLDLKADIIKKCNLAAEKYGYSRLKFEVGDVNGFETPFDVDMVLTLHACDTATDYALYNAVKWQSKLIFSVPCCQHELNSQINAQNLKLLTRYGIIKERFCALATDAIRANLLEYAGYKTQLLEFVDFEHTPKNILIRAVRRPLPVNSVKNTALKESEALMSEFGFSPTLYELLVSESSEHN